MKEKGICIETKNLCKTYYNSKQGVHVIKNLDMEIYEGDFTIIMGVSGSGKTTLLYLLSALDEMTSGEVNYGERSISKMKLNELVDFRRDEIGYIFQGINLVPYLSVLEIDRDKIRYVPLCNDSLCVGSLKTAFIPPLLY